MLVYFSWGDFSEVLIKYAAEFIFDILLYTQVVSRRNNIFDILRKNSK